MSYFNHIRRWRWIFLGRMKIKKQIKVCFKNRAKIKIVVGSGHFHIPGWISTDLPHFDILKEKHWNMFFRNYKIDHILSEHVLEHVTSNQVETIMSFAFKYLNRNGCFRIAVPDKNHPDPDYIEYVKPGGSGPGAADHKSFWDYKSLKELLEKAGYKVNLLEYWTEDGQFNGSDFNFENGKIVRSKSKGFETKIKDYSSLIIDAIKE